MADLIADLRPGAEVTRSGPGGVGKTALASEAVWAIAPGDAPPALFPGGILFYSFYGQPKVEGAMEHIADLCGVEKGGPPQERAARALAGRTALLVLDGAEQADNLRALLDLRGNCCALVTTRVHGGTGVAPLPPGDAASLLRAWAGRWAADDAAVARICELVGHLPLAVRLAGAHMAEMSLAAPEFLAWLESALWDALHDGPHRQDSVAVLLGKSVAVLKPQAWDVLCVVGVLALQPFEAGWVAAALGVEPAAAPVALGEAARLSLLQRADDGSYAVTHALVHTYVREHLEPDPPTLARLAEFMAARVKALWNADKRDFAALARLRPHAVALVGSLARCRAWRESVDMAYALDEVLSTLGFSSEWVTIGEQSVDAARELGSRTDEGNRLGNLGSAFHRLGRVEEAIGYHEQALAISREIGDRGGEGADLGNLGLAYADLGRVEEAIRTYEQALVIAREIGDRRGEGNHLGNLGLAYAALGRVEEAIASYEQALAISREIGDRRGEGARLGNLGLAYADLGRVEEAIGFYGQALVLFREIGDRRGEGNDLGNLGNASYSLGRVEEAIGYHEQALAIAREIGDRRGEANDLCALGIAANSQSRYEDATDLYEQALAIRRATGDLPGEAIDLANLGNTYKQLGRMDDARRCWEEALRIFTAVKSPHAQTVRGWLAGLGPGA